VAIFAIADAGDYCTSADVDCPDWSPRPRPPTRPLDAQDARRRSRGHRQACAPWTAWSRGCWSRSGGRVTRDRASAARVPSMEPPRLR